MMKTTMTLSANLHVSPFDIMDREFDEVIMLINFYIILAENAPKQQKGGAIAQKTAHMNKERIRVNDKTATGGWF